MRQVTLLFLLAELADLLTTWAGLRVGSTTTAGFDQNRNTSSTSITRITGKVYIFQPLKITHIYWDIRNTGTYDLYLSAGKIDTTILSIKTGVSVSSAPSADVDFDISSTPLILLPGVYYFTCKRQEGNTGWSDYNAAGSGYELCYADGYYTDATAGTYTIPMKLCAYIGTIS